MLEPERVGQRNNKKIMVGILLPQQHMPEDKVIVKVNQELQQKKRIREGKR